MTHTIRLVVVSGLSGSGKTTAIRALEDAGFFCIDNLPIVLVEKVLDLCVHSPYQDVAVVVDVRDRTFLGHFEAVLSQVADRGYRVAILFLDCEDDVLVRRFKETRRRHPLQGDGQLPDGIAQERRLLAPIQAAATRVVDTTQMTVHDLRRMLRSEFPTLRSGPMAVHIMSFGFKHGIPLEADWVFDVRFLPNPYFIPELRELTGMDTAVDAFVMGQPDAEPLLDLLVSVLELALPKAETEGKLEVTVAVGCTGGRHRSVALSQRLGTRLEGMPFNVAVVHRDADRT